LTDAVRKVIGAALLILKQLDQVREGKGRDVLCLENMVERLPVDLLVYNRVTFQSERRRSIGSGGSLEPHGVTRNVRISRARGRSRQTCGRI
jgi:hypothetical protein